MENSWKLAPCANKVGGPLCSMHVQNKATGFHCAWLDTV